MSLMSLVPVKAFASQQFALKIDKPIIQITAIPPAKIQSPLTLENTTDTLLNVTISLKPFKPSAKEDGEVVYLSDKEATTSAEASWQDKKLFEKVTVENDGGPITSLTLGPKQKKTLKLVIDLPQEEPADDYYFSILFVSNNTSQQGQNVSYIQGGIASNVLLSIGPMHTPKGYLEEFSAPSYVTAGPIAFTVRVYNADTHVIRPFGVILIKNLFGQTIGRVDLASMNVLKDSIRAFPDINQLLHSDQRDTLTKELHYQLHEDNVYAFWPERFLIGPYTATLTLALSSKGPVFERTIHFFAFPYTAAAGIFVVLFGAAITYRRVKKRMG